MTCFSNEANSLVKDCKELLQTIPNPESRQYPAELLSLQGKRKICQLHFDPECTKDEQVFILDTCWNETPLLISNAPTPPESSLESSKQKPDATMEAKTKSQADPVTATPANTPPKTITAKVETPDTFQPKETDTTPPPKQTPLSETQKATGKVDTPQTSEPKQSDNTLLSETPQTTAKPERPNTSEPKQTDTTLPPNQTILSETPKPRKEQPKRNTRRELFTEDKDTPEKPCLKKSKKTD